MKMEEINTIAQKIGAAMYQQPGALLRAEAGKAEAGVTILAGTSDKKMMVVEGEVWRINNIFIGCPSLRGQHLNKNYVKDYYKILVLGMLPRKKNFCKI